MILAGSARFLAAHTPTRRELPTIVQIAGRLRRGEALYEKADVTLNREPEHSSSHLAGLDKPWDGCHPQRNSPKCCNDPLSWQALCAVESAAHKCRYVRGLGAARSGCR